MAGPVRWEGTGARVHICIFWKQIPSAHLYLPLYLPGSVTNVLVFLPTLCAVLFSAYNHVGSQCCHLHRQDVRNRVSHVEVRGNRTGGKQKNLYSSLGSKPVFPTRGCTILQKLLFPSPPLLSSKSTIAILRKRGY